MNIFPQQGVDSHPDRKAEVNARISINYDSPSSGGKIDNSANMNIFKLPPPNKQPRTTDNATRKGFIFPENIPNQSPKKSYKALSPDQKRDSARINLKLIPNARDSLSPEYLCNQILTLLEFKDGNFLVKRETEPVPQSLTGLSENEIKSIVTNAITLLRLNINFSKFLGCLQDLNEETIIQTPSQSEVSLENLKKEYGMSISTIQKAIECIEKYAVTQPSPTTTNGIAVKFGAEGQLSYEFENKLKELMNIYAQLSLNDGSQNLAKLAKAIEDAQLSYEQTFPTLLKRAKLLIATISSLQSQLIDKLEQMKKKISTETLQRIAEDRIASLRAFLKDCHERVSQLEKETLQCLQRNFKSETQFPFFIILNPKFQTELKDLKMKAQNCRFMFQSFRDRARKERQFFHENSIVNDVAKDLFQECEEASREFIDHVEAMITIEEGAGHLKLSADRLQQTMQSYQTMREEIQKMVLACRNPQDIFLNENTAKTYNSLMNQMNEKLAMLYNAIEPLKLVTGRYLIKYAEDLKRSILELQHSTILEHNELLILKKPDFVQILDLTSPTKLTKAAFDQEMVTLNSKREELISSALKDYSDPFKVEINPEMYEELVSRARKLKHVKTYEQQADGILHDLDDLRFLEEQNKHLRIALNKFFDSFEGMKDCSSSLLSIGNRIDNRALNSTRLSGDLRRQSQVLKELYALLSPLLKPFADLEGLVFTKKEILKFRLPEIEQGHIDKLLNYHVMKKSFSLQGKINDFIYQVYHSTQELLQKLKLLFVKNHGSRSDPFAEIFKGFERIRKFLPQSFIIFILTLQEIWGHLIKQSKIINYFINCFDKENFRFFHVASSAFPEGIQQLVSLREEVSRLRDRASNYHSLEQRVVFLTKANEFVENTIKTFVKIVEQSASLTQILSRGVSISSKYTEIYELIEMCFEMSSNERLADLKSKLNKSSLEIIEEYCVSLQSALWNMKDDYLVAQNYADLEKIFINRMNGNPDDFLGDAEIRLNNDSVNYSTFVNLIRQRISSSQQFGGDFDVRFKGYYLTNEKEILVPIDVLNQNQYILRDKLLGIGDRGVRIVDKVTSKIVKEFLKQSQARANVQMSNSNINQGSQRKKVFGGVPEDMNRIEYQQENKSAGYQPYQSNLAGSQGENRSRAQSEANKSGYQSEIKQFGGQSEGRSQPGTQIGGSGMLGQQNVNMEESKVGNQGFDNRGNVQNESKVFGSQMGQAGENKQIEGQLEGGSQFDNRYGKESGFQMAQSRFENRSEASKFGYQNEDMQIGGQLGGSSRLGTQIGGSGITGLQNGNVDRLEESKAGNQANVGGDTGKFGQGQNESNFGGVSGSQMGQSRFGVQSETSKFGQQNEGNFGKASEPQIGENKLGFQSEVNKFGSQSENKQIGSQIESGRQIEVQFDSQFGKTSGPQAGDNKFGFQSEPNKLGFQNENRGFGYQSEPNKNINLEERATGGFKNENNSLSQPGMAGSQFSFGKNDRQSHPEQLVQQKSEPYESEANKKETPTMSQSLYEQKMQHFQAEMEARIGMAKSQTGGSTQNTFGVDQNAQKREPEAQGQLQMGGSGKVEGEDPIMRHTSPKNTLSKFHPSNSGVIGDPSLNINIEAKTSLQIQGHGKHQEHEEEENLWKDF